MEVTEHVHEHHDHKTPVQAYIKVALLIGLGLYFVYLIATGNLTNYINARFTWLSYLAAALFLALGAANAYQLWGARALHDHDHHGHDHDHDHGTISWAVLAVVAVPLVLGTMLPSRPLGAAAVDGDLSANTVGGSSDFTIPPEQRNILDWVRAINSTDDLTAFNGQPVDVVGFVYRGEGYPGDQFLVARFTISCCVADSVAIGLPVTWADALPADTWVRVQGQFVSGSFQGEARSVIQPVSVEIVEQPQHPYLYP